MTNIFILEKRFHNLSTKADLKAFRQTCIDESKAILAEVDQEKRDIYSYEEDNFNKILNMAEKCNARLQDGAFSEPAPIPDTDYDGGSRGVLTDKNSFRVELQDGREVRGFRNGAKLYDHLRFALPDGLRKEELSLGKWFRGMLTGAWDNAAAERRVAAVGNDIIGGYLVPSPLAAQVFDLARNQARVMQAGGGIIPMETSTLAIGRITSDPSAAWTAENAAISSSDMEIGRYELKARKLAVMCKLSRELAEDSTLFGTALSNAMSAALALEMDRAALYGIGAAEEPMGLKNWPDVQSIDMGTNGGVPDGYTTYSNGWLKLLNENCPEDGLSIIMNPRERGLVDRMKDGMGNPLQPCESWKSMAKFTTNQCPITLTHGTAVNASDVFIGRFSELYFGIRSNMTLEVSRETSEAFEKHQIWIKMTARMDTLVAYPKWFCILDGCIPSGS